MKILLILISQIVYVYNSSQFYSHVSWTSLSCWADTFPRTVPTLEGTTPILDGNYKTRKNAIEKCARAAAQLGFEVFVLQDGGWCGSSADARSRYQAQGSALCLSNDGKGRSNINHVYELHIKDVVFSGSFDTTLSSTQPKRKLNLLYRLNVCLGSAPYKMNATARVETAGEQATFNVTILSISTVSALVELERSDKPTGWSTIGIIVDWIIFFKPTI